MGLGSVPWARLTILVDNAPDPSGLLRSSWGLSVLVEAPGVRVLFDADTEPGVLEWNSRLLSADLASVDFVVVSHEHRDHTGGLEYVARVKPGATVYAPAHMDRGVAERLESMGFRVVGVGETVEVAGGVAVVGELYGPPYEQALAVNIEGLGLVVLVGCSHPGVDRIVEKAFRDLGVRPHAVLGGFHLSGAPRGEVERVMDRLAGLGVERVYPMHCSGDEAKRTLRERHPQRYGEARTGSRIEFTGQTAG